MIKINDIQTDEINAKRVLYAHIYKYILYIVLFCLVFFFSAKVKTWFKQLPSFFHSFFFLAKILFFLYVVRRFVYRFSARCHSSTSSVNAMIVTLVAMEHTFWNFYTSYQLSSHLSNYMNDARTLGSHLYAWIIPPSKSNFLLLPNSFRKS